MEQGELDYVSWNYTGSFSIVAWKKNCSLFFISSDLTVD